MTTRCRCGQTEIPAGGHVVETGVQPNLTYHYFDKCTDVFVYDEWADLPPGPLPDFFELP